MPRRSETKTIVVQYENGVLAKDIEVSLCNRDGCFGTEFTDEHGEVEFETEGNLADSDFTIYADGQVEFTGSFDESVVITIEGEGYGCIDADVDENGYAQIVVRVHNGGTPVKNCCVAISNNDGELDEGYTDSDGSVELTVLGKFLGGDCTIYVDGQLSYQDTMMIGIDIDIDEEKNEDQDDDGFEGEEADDQD